MLRQIAVGGRAVLVDGCGHWIPQERPDVLADVMVSITATGTGRECSAE